MPFGHYLLAAVAMSLALLVAADDVGRGGALNPSERHGAGSVAGDDQPPRLPPNQTRNDTKRLGQPAHEGEVRDELPPRGEGFRSDLGPRRDPLAHTDGDSLAQNATDTAPGSAGGRVRDPSFAGASERPSGSDEGSNRRGVNPRPDNDAQPQRPRCQGRAENETRPLVNRTRNETNDDRAGPGSVHLPLAQNGTNSGACPESAPSNRSGVETKEMSGSLGGSSSMYGSGNGATYEGAESEADRSGLSRKGVILVAVGGALLGAGLASLAVALILHKRSADRVRAFSQEPVAVPVGKAGPVVPDVILIESVAAGADGPETAGVCLGVVVHKLA